MRSLGLLLSYGIFSVAVHADSVLVGKWKGTYYGCGQGVPTNAEIDVYDNLNAVFRFHAATSSIGAFDGIFPGTFKQNGSAIEFTPSISGIAAWYIKPNGTWASIGFNASLDEANAKMLGKVVSAGCTTIELTKVATNGCEANFSDANLHIPCVKVPNPSGNATTYDVQMKWLPSFTPLTFELTGAQVK